MSNFAEAKAYCRSIFFGAHEEMVYALCLDQSGRVIHCALLRRGTVDEVAIYPRDVVETVIRCRAHSVMLAHNHPSGSLSPSQADIDMTIRIAKALKAIDVSLSDHLIYADGEIVSMLRELSSYAQHTIRQEEGLREERPAQDGPTLDALLLG